MRRRRFPSGPAGECRNLRPTDPSEPSSGPTAQGSAPPAVGADRGFVLLVAGLMTMSAASIDINLPALPATAAAFGTGLAAAQLTVSAFFLGFALGQGIVGPAADRFGRRPILLGGIALYVLSSLACAAAPAIEALSALRLLQGFAAAVGPVLGRAVVRDRFEGPAMARVLSLAMAAFVLAPILAPSLGALILELGSWRWIFAALAGYGALLLAVAAARLEETLRRPDPSALRPARIAAAWRRVLGEPRSRPFLAIGVLSLATLVLYLVNAPALFMAGYGLEPRGFALVFALLGAAAAVGSLLNARLARRLALERTIAIGLGLGLAATLANLVLALAGLAGAPSVLPGLCLFFLSFGLVTANATALALQPHGDAAGSAASVTGVLQTVIPGLLAGAAALLLDGVPEGLLLVMPVPVAAAALVLLLSGRRARPSPRPFL